MDGELSKELEVRVNEIRTHLAQAKSDGWTLNEADTERIIISPLLSVLGYSPIEIRQRGHDSVANNFPDYTLLPNTPQKWFLEVKKLDHALADGEAAQAVNYANNQGAEWAVLTNGRKWYIYNVRLPKPLAEKRVFQIADLFAESPLAQTLKFLSRSSILSDGLAQAWALSQVRTIIQEQLYTPTSRIRKQLLKIASERVTAPVSDALIGQALADFSPGCQSAAQIDNSASVSIQSATIPVKVGSGILHTIPELAADRSLCTGKRPACLYFTDGHAETVATWAGACIAIILQIGEKIGLPPLPFTNRPRGKSYFLNSQPIHSTGIPMKTHRTGNVGDMPVYMDTHRSASDLVNTVMDVCRTIGVPEDFVKIEIAG